MTEDMAQAELESAREAEDAADARVDALVERIEAAKELIRSTQEELKAVKLELAAAKVDARNALAARKQVEGAVLREARAARNEAESAALRIENHAAVLEASADRWLQRNAPSVRTGRPYLQCHSDACAYEAHQVVDGLTWHVDNKAFDEFVPPFCVGCTCSVVSLAEERVQQGGLSIASAMPDGFSIEAGSGLAGVQRVLSERGKQRRI